MCEHKRSADKGGNNSRIATHLVCMEEIQSRHFRRETI
jgi:hypothetical protein